MGPRHGRLRRVGPLPLRSPTSRQVRADGGFLTGPTPLPDRSRNTYRRQNFPPACSLVILQTLTPDRPVAGLDTIHQGSPCRRVRVGMRLDGGNRRNRQGFVTGVDDAGGGKRPRLSMLSGRTFTIRAPQGRRCRAVWYRRPVTLGQQPQWAARTVAVHQFNSPPLQNFAVGSPAVQALMGVVPSKRATCPRPDKAAVAAANRRHYRSPAFRSRTFGDSSRRCRLGHSLGTGNLSSGRPRTFTRQLTGDSRTVDAEA